MTWADAILFKKEDELYSHSLSELNYKFNILEDLKWVAKGNIQSLQEQVKALEKKLASREKELEDYKAHEDECWT